MLRLKYGVVAAILAFATGCATNESAAPLESNLGGDTTLTEIGNNAFGLPASNLAKDDRLKFQQGNSFFTQNWVTAPSTTVARDGLGPVFNGQACATCHVLDGRGAPPTGPDDNTTRGLLIRLSIPSDNDNKAPEPEPNYGDQLQDRAVDGVPVEGVMKVTYTEVPGTYGDGSPYSLRQPTFEITNLAFGSLHKDVMTSPRIAPQMVGMGLLEAIPVDSLEKAADPQDTNGDGVSGRPNYVWSTVANDRVVGRFGWKANASSVQEQIAGAFQGDIGITSSIRDVEPCTIPQKACLEFPNGGAPEIDDARLDAVTFYSRVLAVPAMRDVDDSKVKDGAKQFVAMGCAMCHTPTQKTGESDIPALKNQTVHPFTDLLLHDMGPGLADNRPDFEANGQEWRTPPLWGLGLSDDVNGNRFLMHDGRARTFEEAILWHGGEGEAAKEKFRSASPEQRASLIAYLEAL